MQPNLESVYWIMKFIMRYEKYYNYMLGEEASYVAYGKTINPWVV